MGKRTLIIGVWHDYDTLMPQLEQYLGRESAEVPTDILVIASKTGAANIRRLNLLGLEAGTQSTITLKNQSVRVTLYTLKKNGGAELDALSNQKNALAIKKGLMQIIHACGNSSEDICDCIFNEDAPPKIRSGLMALLALGSRVTVGDLFLYWAAAPSGAASWTISAQQPISQPQYQLTPQPLSPYSVEEVDPKDPALLHIGKTIRLDGIELGQALTKQPVITYSWIVSRKKQRNRLTFVYGDSKQTPGDVGLQWTGATTPSFKIIEQPTRIANPEEKVWFFWQAYQYLVFNQFISKGASDFKLFFGMSNTEMLRTVDNVARQHYGVTDLKSLYDHLDAHFKQHNLTPCLDLANSFGGKLSTDITRANGLIEVAIQKAQATHPRPVNATDYTVQSICSKDSGVRRYDTRLRADQIALSPQIAKLIGGDQNPRHGEIPPRPLQQAIARV